MSEKILVRVIQWGVIASFIMPLIVTGQSTIFPFVFAKAIYLRVLVELLLIIYAALIIWYPAYRPRRTFIFYMVWALMGALILSSIFGVDFSHSFWGNYERMSGVFTIVHFAVLMVIASAVFRTEKEWLIVWRVALVVGLIVGITGLNFLLPDDSIMKIGGGGTLGNLIYLANYVMFTVIIAWYVWKVDTHKLWRYGAVAIGVIGVLIMMYNGKRGPFIGLIVGILMGTIIYLSVDHRRQIRNVCVGLLIGIIIVLGSAFIFRDTKFISNITLLRELTHTSLTGGTAETRFIAWNIAWQAFKDYPIFGWGSENFYYAFNKYYNPVSLQHGYYETWFDRSHNIFLDYLSMNGIIGFLLYVGVFVAVFYAAIQHFRLKRINLSAFLFILAFFAAFISQSVFVFDHLSSYLIFFLALAFTNVLTTHTLLPQRSEPGTSAGTLASLPLIKISAVALILLWMVVRYNIQEFDVNNETLLDQKLFNGHAAEALTQFTALIKGPTVYQSDVAGNYSQAILNFLQDPQNAQKPELQPFWQLAIDGLKETMNAHPLELNGLLKLAELERVGTAYDSHGLDKAEKYYEQALTLSPQRQQIIYSWTRLKLERKDYDGALKLLDRAIADDAKISDSFWYKAIVLTQMGKKDEAFINLKQALDLGKSPSNFQEEIFVADSLAQAEELERSVQYYEQALNEQPKNAKLLLTLAEIYTKIGRSDRAKEMVDRAQLADPALVEQLKQEIAKQKK